jgi:hypothetical protein
VRVDQSGRALIRAGGPCGPHPVGLGLGFVGLLLRVVGVLLGVAPGLAAFDVRAKGIPPLRLLGEQVGGLGLLLEVVGLHLHVRRVLFGLLGPDFQKLPIEEVFAFGAEAAPGAGDGSAPLVVDGHRGVEAGRRAVLEFGPVQAAERAGDFRLASLRAFDAGRLAGHGFLRGWSVPVYR